MKKYIVLSVNDNVDYLYFSPLTVWTWKQFGWEPILMYHGERNTFLITDTLAKLGIDIKVVSVHSIDGYRSDTITQISRLYGALATPSDEECYLMTGDIDMLALSDYWKPSLTKATVYGHDLTGFGHFPICYIGMPRNIWREVMKVREDYPISTWIERDLDTLPQAKDTDFYKYWFSDQDLITARLKEYGTEKIDFINRGQYANGFARGRVDRGSWTLSHDMFVDAHLMQQTHHSEEKIQKLYDLLHHVWPNEDFTWFKEYTKEFKRLAV
jgi:hypothetical protein